MIEKKKIGYKELQYYFSLLPSLAMLLQESDLLPIKIKPRFRVSI